jgi:hypothetical protein
VPSPLPATRITKRSFGPSLKINSIGTRASEQPRMTANGRCFGSAGSPARSPRSPDQQDNFCICHPRPLPSRRAATPSCYVKTDVRGITVQWPRPGGCGLRPYRYVNIDCLHISH